MAVGIVSPPAVSTCHLHGCGFLVDVGVQNACADSLHTMRCMLRCAFGLYHGSPHCFRDRVQFSVLLPFTGLTMQKR